MKKITICGSVSSIDKMLSCKEELESFGFTVFVPSLSAQSRTEHIREHFQEIISSDLILVTNYEKNGIEDYIGGSVLMEMGVTFFLNKPIYLLNNIPEVSYKDEIIALEPIVLNGNLKRLHIQ